MQHHIIYAHLKVAWLAFVVLFMTSKLIRLAKKLKSTLQHHIIYVNRERNCSVGRSNYVQN